jgi:glucose-6-phosphate isomerase
MAHSKLGKSHNLVIHLAKSDAYHFGYFFIWLAMSITMSGYLLKINPFNQPGVDAYKKNMLSLLAK